MNRAKDLDEISFKTCHSISDSNESLTDTFSNFSEYIKDIYDIEDCPLMSSETLEAIVESFF